MSVVAAEHCSKWYGHVLGISDVTWKLQRAVSSSHVFSCSGA